MGESVAKLRLVCLLETASFLGLLLMMLIGSEAGVSIVGLVHGLLFLWYALLVVTDRTKLTWSWTFAIVVVVTGPIGALIVIERLRREHQIIVDETT